MNQVNNEQKTALMKLLAIVGLLAVLVFGAWVAVRVVVLLPAAFTSLASLADGVYTYSEEVKEITVTSNDAVVASGDVTELSWTESNQQGSYYVSYACVDGVSLSFVTEDGETLVDCGERFKSENTFATIRIESEKDRFTDIPFEVLFVSDNADETSATTLITAVNASITPAEVPVIELTDLTDEDETVSDEDVTVATEESTPESDLITPPAPVVTPEYEFITQIPTSDPNGYADLAIRYLGVGTMVNDRFQFSSTIDNDEMGAIQFEVKNTGTKTSNSWTFAVDLPNGLDYRSGNQTPLKPNERAVLTVGFASDDIEGIQSFSAKIITDSDLDVSNNEFDWAVEFVD